MDAATDFNVVRDVFCRIAPIELSYRDQPEELSPVFGDIRQTALCISTRGLEGEGQFQLLQDGITSMQPFTIGSRYVIENATIDAAKAALLATMIEKGVDKFIPFSQARENLANLRLVESVPKRLVRLRRNNPEAFYYWVKTSELLNQ